MDQKQPLGFSLSSIDVSGMLRAVARSFWLVVLAVLIAAMGTYTVLQTVYKPQYTCSATYIVSSKYSTTSYSNISATSDTASLFSQLLDSQVLRKHAAEAIGLEDLPADIKATVAENTNVLTLTSTADTAYDAFNCLKAVTENYNLISDNVFNTIVLTVIDGPYIPTAPSNQIDIGATMLRACGIGALLMILLIALLTVCRDTIQTVSCIERKLDIGRFGVVYHERKNRTLRASLRKVNRSVLLTNPMASFPFTETISKMCTRLEYAQTRRDRKVILVTSVGENEGKSTMAANLALCLAQRHGRVLLVDGDLRKPAVHKLLELQPEPEQELSHYLSDNACSLESYLSSAVLRDTKTGLYAITGRHAVPMSSELVSSDRMEKLLHFFRGQMDYIIIDSPPMALFSDAEALARFADASLLVIRQSASLAQEINTAADTLEGSHAELLGCIFNDVYGMPFPLSLLDNDSYSYGYGNLKSYGRYRKYGKYGHYGHYGRYGEYAAAAAHTPDTPKDDGSDQTEVN